MKFRVLLGLALVALAVIPALADKSAPSHPDRLGFDVRITPMTRPANPAATPQFMATVVVTRLETGEVIFAPKVQTLSGIPATLSSAGGEGPQWKVHFLIDGSVASYTIEATLDGAPVVSNSGSIQLQNPKTP